jgi:hypothetical protein
MLQSDILAFRLPGKNAYFIGQIDDFNLYINVLRLYTAAERLKT